MEIFYNLGVGKTLPTMIHTSDVIKQEKINQFNYIQIIPKKEKKNFGKIKSQNTGKLFPHSTDKELISIICNTLLKILKKDQ